MKINYIYENRWISYKPCLGPLAPIHERQTQRHQFTSVESHEHSCTNTNIHSRTLNKYEHSTCVLYNITGKMTIVKRVTMTNAVCHCFCHTCAANNFLGRTCVAKYSLGHTCARPYFEARPHKSEIQSTCLLGVL